MTQPQNVRHSHVPKAAELSESDLRVLKAHTDANFNFHQYQMDPPPQIVGVRARYLELIAQQKTGGPPVKLPAAPPPPKLKLPEPEWFAWFDWDGFLRPECRHQVVYLATLAGLIVPIAAVFFMK